MTMAGESTAIFKNNRAVFLWVFMTIWMSFLVIFTWLFLREGGFRQFDPLVETAIMLFFWIIGLPVTAHAFGSPCIRVEVGLGQVMLQERWLWRVGVERFAAQSVAEPKIVDGKDDEGDPYFRCLLTTPQGKTVTLCESHDRDVVAAAHGRLLQAMKGV